MVIEPGIHVITSEDLLRQMGQEANGMDFQLFEVILDAQTSKAGLFERLKAGLSLPSYFGANWDALEESLRDLDIHNHRGVLLTFRSADGLLTLPSSDLRTLVCVLGEAVRFWKTEGVIFSAVLVGSSALADTVRTLQEPTARA